MARLRALLVFGVLGWGRMLLLGLLLGGMLLSAVIATNEIRREDPVTLQVRAATDPGLIRVYVGGAVVNPGIVDLSRGSRVAEAIDAAGGLTDVGDASALGMAGVLHDSDQVIVPVRRASGPSPTSVVAPAVAAVAPTSAPTGATPTTTAIEVIHATQTPAPPQSVANNGLINVNTASLAELESLPEIGPALAQRIIDYRIANGPFQTLDELADVKGISPRIVELIRPLATTVN